MCSGKNASEILLLVFIYRLKPTKTQKRSITPGQETQRLYLLTNLLNTQASPIWLLVFSPSLDNLILLHLPPQVTDQYMREFSYI
jgi:hypothetical protein